MHDVVIAGAGPVGLMLAVELRLAGVPVRVLERAPSPEAPLKRLPFGMRGLSSPSLDALHRRDLLQAVLPPPGDGAPRGGGHFAGIAFAPGQVDASAWPYRVGGPAPTHAMVEMATLERVLAERAVALGADIHRGVAVEGLAQDADGVLVHTTGGNLRARWLVGCDGGRSVVRKAAGFDFDGTPAQFTGYTVAVDLAAPQALPAGRHYTPGGMYLFTPPGVLAMVEFDGGAQHRTALTRAQVQAVLRRVTGSEAEVRHLHLATTWTDRACLAGSYRRGRVLLAGDAAHIHSPLGGQGLNLGLGDAVNLGWKLAASVRGTAPPDLLDSYTAERQPVAAQVLDGSRAQVALMRPEPGARALAAIFRDLIHTPDGATCIAGRLWGTTLRHALGEGHPLLGHSAPDLVLADGRRLGEHLRSGRGLLVDATADPALRALAARWRDRVDYATCAAALPGVSALCVRPDGLVAWATAGVAEPGPAAEALARWFGAPA